MNRKRMVTKQQITISLTEIEGWFFEGHPEINRSAFTRKAMDVAIEKYYS